VPSYDASIARATSLGRCKDGFDVANYGCEVACVGGDVHPMAAARVRCYASVQPRGNRGQKSSTLAL
jgi:hypothetical protein